MRNVKVANKILYFASDFKAKIPRSIIKDRIKRYFNDPLFGPGNKIEDRQELYARMVNTCLHPTPRELEKYGHFLTKNCLEALSEVGREIFDPGYKIPDHG